MSLPVSVPSQYCDCASHVALPQAKLVQAPSFRIETPA